ncbi:hypothetical protein AR543_15510 [Paenibacillus bovis]|uniref:SLH domain-containing protein n=2 Tax=Paenibacillus bovis TaxID=1616788 RepID=A0A172ZJ15_9BACL|nr:hypothetical protein AR543_15510 [Paenibacillus bovis]
MYTVIIAMGLIITGCQTETSADQAVQKNPQENTVGTDEQSVDDPLAAPTAVYVNVQEQASSNESAQEPTDIAQTAEKEYIQKLLKSGAAKLDQQGKFMPEQPITRTEFINWMYNYNNKHIKPHNAKTPSFNDLTPENVNYTLIEGMKAAGVIIGFPDGSMQLDKALTRQELTLLWGWYTPEYLIIDPVLNKKTTRTYGLRPYRDSKQVGEPYVTSMNFYLNGEHDVYFDIFPKGKELKPQESVTRAQATHWIVANNKVNEKQEKQDERLARNNNEVAPAVSPSLSDQITVTDIADSSVKGQITRLLQSGAASVNEQGEFQPDDVVTRRDFIRWMYKYDFKKWDAVSSSNPSYEDVPVTDPDYAIVETMKAADAIIPLDNNKLELDRPLTREQLALLWYWYQDEDRVKDPMLNLNTIKAGTSTIPDFDRIGTTYADPEPYIRAVAAAENGLYRNVFGYVKSLNPQQEVTRAEAAQWLVDGKDN